MNLIKSKLILAKSLNSSLNFLKKNKPVFVKQIKKISSTLQINKKPLIEKKMFVIKSMAVILLSWIISYPFISLNVDQKNSFLEVKKGENILKLLINL